MAASLLGILFLMRRRRSRHSLLLFTVGIFFAPATFAQDGASSNGPAEAAPTEPTRQRILVLDLEAQGADGTVTRVAQDTVTLELSRNPALDIITSGELRQMVELEAEREAMGCDDSSCLAEVAGAMGAELVVYGNVAQLGTLTVVTLNLFDAQKARSVSRERAEARSVELMPRAVEAATRRMLGEDDAEVTASEDQAAGASSAQAERSMLGWTLPIGAGAVGAGVLALGAASGVIAAVLLLGNEQDAWGGPGLFGAFVGASVLGGIGFVLGPAFLVAAGAGWFVFE